uniref:Phosphatidylinositol-specific phospholipase C X domain-containing protein n=1 Tax=Plectus sambesii TaxID=2011161 RepID=A0A914WEZ9_9BILA
MGSLDMANWMTNLPAEFTAKPLLNLIIPGSHDSFTFSLDKDGPIANSEPAWMQNIDWLPGFKGIVYRWSVTQKYTTTEQLDNGVRYFDFRLSRPDNEDTIKVVHGFYGSEIGPILADMVAWLQQHPREVVFFDFNHFYNFDSDTHKMLTDALIGMLGPKMCPARRPRDVNLNQMWQSGYQVLAFYDDDESVADHPQLWPDDQMQSPWANTDTPKQLVAYLQDQLMKRPLGDNATFFNTQGILTPQTSDVLLHFYSSLEAYLATPTTQRLVYWLRDFLPFLKPRFNIVFCDFVDKFDFCRTVVQLNFSSKRCY